jgi:outer membrane lipopolysaccharide assembly protein LptE/RlpB
MRVIPLLLFLSVLTTLTGCGVQLEGSAANQRATLRAM